ncbi:MAG: complement resistance protein TraT [Alphaproteobacteria bacterium]|nr:complement resistance protein TraT [Alphaproteobacteria bacterium]
MNKAYIFSLGLICSLFITGCGDIQVYDVDTKFSNVIQVEPVSKGRRSVYLRIKDVTGHASELATSIEQQLKTEGYYVVTDPGIATYKLMINVIKFGGGTSNDEITFMQAIDPAKAAELAIQKNRIKTIRRNTNVYEKKNSGYFHSPYGQRKNDRYVDDEIIEESSIRSFADRVGIADIEIISLNGKNLKTRLMVGVNMRGGLFQSPTPEVDRHGWTRLIQRLTLAVSSMF